MADSSKGNDAAGAKAGEDHETKAQPSGPKGDNPATAGHGETKVHTGPAEQAAGRLNPSSPGNTGTTPGSDAELG